MNLSLFRRQLNVSSLFNQLQVISITTFIQTNAVRVDTNIEPTTRVSESVDPKAEALTLVIHNFPMPKLRPVKLSDRNDDIVVIHSNRPKRKPNTRNRRPSSQFRSKIKNPGSSSSSFGGFKDFSSSSDFRFPPFSTKNLAEPPRASNKYKNGPPKAALDGYSYIPPSKKRPKKKPSSLYGPPPSFSQFESSYDAPSSPLNGQRLQTLQSIQQHQTQFPSFSSEPVDPAIANFYTASNDKFPQPINNFPLEQAPTYNSHKTSYGNPVRGSSNPSNFNYNANILGTSLDSNLNSNLGSQSSSYSNFNQNIENPIPKQKTKQNQNSNSNFPKLPSRYEPKDFSTPMKQNPLSGNGNHFLNEYSGFNDGSETQNVHATANHNLNNNNRNRLNKVSSFNKFNNFDYDFKGTKNSAPEEDEDDEGNYDYNAYTTRRPTTTTTTEEPEPSTKRPKKNIFGKRKRPTKIPQTHILDTDDLRDAFTESSDFHEIGLNSDDFINFDSQRNNKRNHQQSLHEIHSTLKTARKQSSALRTALGDDFEIVSVQKSLEKDPNDVDPFGFERKHDQDFVVDSDISFAPFAANSPDVMWNGDVKNFPRNHRFL